MSECIGRGAGAPLMYFVNARADDPFHDTIVPPVRETYRGVEANYLYTEACNALERISELFADDLTTAYEDNPEFYSGCIGRRLNPRDYDGDTNYRGLEVLTCIAPGYYLSQYGNVYRKDEHEYARYVRCSDFDYDDNGIKIVDYVVNHRHCRKPLLELLAEGFLKYCDFEAYSVLCAIYDTLVTIVTDMKYEDGKADDDTLSNVIDQCTWDFYREMFPYGYINLRGEFL